ncbi:hypothetical protein IKF63_00485 [Candidatus Saccharibacteria bacterium]|nr:hypothetical protein [Candidatus Saccharibacteria bacterium]
MRKNDEKELVKKFEIPETVRKVFDLKNQAIIGEEEKEKSSVKQLVEIRRLSQLAGKPLLELVKELKKVKLEKNEVVKEVYSENQNGIDYMLYLKLNPEAREKLEFLTKQERVLEERIKELKNDT